MLQIIFETKSLQAVAFQLDFDPYQFADKILVSSRRLTLANVIEDVIVQISDAMRIRPVEQFIDDLKEGEMISVSVLTGDGRKELKAKVSKAYSKDRLQGPFGDLAKAILAAYVMTVVTEYQ